MSLLITTVQNQGQDREHQDKKGIFKRIWTNKIKCAVMAANAYYFE